MTRKKSSQIPCPEKKARKRRSQFMYTMKRVVMCSDREKAMKTFGIFYGFAKWSRCEQGEGFDKKYPFLDSYLDKETINEFCTGTKEKQARELWIFIQNMGSDDHLKVMDGVLRHVWLCYLSVA
jgi:hypothetical protein